MKRGATLKRFGTIEDMKADSYCYWREQPDYARLAAVTQLNWEAYGLNGVSTKEPRLQKVVRLMRREPIDRADD